MSTCIVLFNVSAQTDEEKAQHEHNQWLKDTFSKQHEALIPVVAVADMFYACNKKRKIDPIGYQVKELIVKMDRDVLANKLAQCLAGESIKSETALNFGLLGCFHEQLQELSKEDRQQKMVIVERAIASLTFEERQKSFTQCVTDQAIGYLK
ncbi:hypothetical protein [Thalassotalea piscium]|uniref:Uncharacterized protein n=1 Tax=Thalassotalea piscium TaxID=1230533 RepID=A0A7X0NI23_9GAMM|nr:hypothetical protein [Thalassotalea piscium]MBB6543805.1 hypothetical protein [Thalassotalea piscium]